MTFWQKYEMLCNEKGVSPTGLEMQKVTGVSSAAITNWKTRNAQPKDFKIIQTLADYFQVDFRYLLGVSERKHGEDIIEKGIDKLVESGCEIYSINTDTGIGKEYVITYQNNSFNYQEHDFRSLCEQLIVAINDNEIKTVKNFCNETFSNEEFSDEEIELIRYYRELSEEGKKIIRGLIYDRRS